MDTAEDAREYDAMDHAAVNASFVTDLLARPDGLVASATSPAATLSILDLGAGTAQIPIELARRAPTRSHHRRRRRRKHARARPRRTSPPPASPIASTSSSPTPSNLPFADGIVPRRHQQQHRPPHPRAARRDRRSDPRHRPRRSAVPPRPGPPDDEASLQQLGRPPTPRDATPYQRKLFADSLHAALTLDEMRDLVASFGFAPDTVRMTSDRHWTWSATRM